MLLIDDLIDKSISLEVNKQNLIVDEAHSV